MKLESITSKMARTIAAEPTCYTDPMMYMEMSETGEDIEATFRIMPKNIGELVWLRYVEGLGIAKISSIVGIPEALVSSRLAYGVKEFKAIYKTVHG
jgi:DNA-directed RNA polymerase specialized sigma24 family protein